MVDPAELKKKLASLKRACGQTRWSFPPSPAPHARFSASELARIIDEARRADPGVQAATAAHGHSGRKPKQEPIYDEDDDGEDWDD